MLFGLVTTPSEECWTFSKCRPDLSEHGEYFARVQSEYVRNICDDVKSYGYLFEGEIKPLLSRAKNTKNKKSWKLSICEILNFHYFNVDDF